MDSAQDTLAGGLPHSDIHGSTPARGSPWLVAACHVLHRLLVPRHPPNALLALEISVPSQGPNDPPCTGAILRCRQSASNGQSDHRNRTKPEATPHQSPPPSPAPRIAPDHRKPRTDACSAGLELSTHIGIPSGTPDASERSRCCRWPPHPSQGMHVPVRLAASENGGRGDQPSPGSAPRDAPEPDSH